ncbi:MAG TPA: dihydropteroate synthase [Rhizomicrobium sp.]
MIAAPQLLGILNITEDSFSDGGRFLKPEAASKRARELLRAGADIIDLGAAASNPGAKPVESEQEIARLAPAVAAVRAAGAAVSIDSFSPQTQLWAMDQNVEYLNDINGFKEPSLYPALAGSTAKLIVMHALRPGPPDRNVPAPADIVDRIQIFFEHRLRALTEAGVARHRLILDPGMGLFLGRGREASFAVLRRLSEIKAAFGLPVLVSVSRKSFLRTLVGRGVAEAGPASLAAELFATRSGADFIRTHEPGPLRDALTITLALEGGTP